MLVHIFDAGGFWGHVAQYHIKKLFLAARFGYEVSAGVHFLLDVLDPVSAASGQGHGMYEHTFLSLEVSYMPVNNFGAVGLDLSPTRLFGSNLPLMFTGALVIEFQ